MIGQIRQELLSGIKTTEQYERLRVHLRSFPDEVVDISDYEEAAKSGSRCRTKGVAVSIVDTLLSAIAIKRQWAIFTTDADSATQGFFLSGFILLDDDNSLYQFAEPFGSLKCNPILW